MVEPILKWAGGKRQLLSSITAVFPESFNHYHEPFFGGGAVFFSLEPEDGTINDLNQRLMDFYRMVKRWPEDLIEENTTHEHTEDYYYQVRDEFNDLRDLEEKSKSDAIREASLLLYLNRTCFNGLYRENSNGEFNVPFGSYSNPNWIQADRIRAMSRVIQDTEIRNEDFEYVRDVTEPNDLVYFDPPYQPVSTTADFTDYHAEGFTKADQTRLRDLAIDLSERDVYVVASNSPPVAALYEDYDEFDVQEVDASRSINSDGANRGDVAEILITNVPSAMQRERTLSEFIN